MPRPKKKPDSIVRKKFGATLDARLLTDLKKLSKEINKPAYLMVEEAIKTYILRKRKFHKKRMARTKDRPDSTAEE